MVLGVDAAAEDRTKVLGKNSEHLLLHDFNRIDLTNNVGGKSEEWSVRFDLSSAELEIFTTERHGNRENALRLSYNFASYSSPESGFRTRLNLLDATAYDHLEFWVKGEPGNGYGALFKVSLQRIRSDMPGFVENGSFIVTDITDRWKKVRVPLNIMNGIETWNQLESLIISVHPRRSGATEGVYFVDEIALVKTERPGPSIHDRVIPKQKKLWEKSLGGEDAAKPHILARLVERPSRTLIAKESVIKDDTSFLLRLAEDTWRGLSALTDREHGLPVDHLHLVDGSAKPEKTVVGDYTSVTNIGVYLLSIVAAMDFEFITRQQALDKLNKIHSSLEKLETYNGFYYNYYDTTTLERTSNFISFVDSSWLTAGLMVARTAFPEFYNRSTKLIDTGDYGWFYDEVEQLMRHGYWTNIEYPSEYHYGLLYTESRVGSIIAIGKGDVPEEHWFKMARTLPTVLDRQSGTPSFHRTKLVRDNNLVNGYYEWNGLKYVPSWGGSAFEALMSTLVLDEEKYAPKSLGINNLMHAMIHRRYALEELGYPVWGMSPSSTIESEGYSEYGVKILGSMGYKEGVVTPHASALALTITPKEALANLRKLVELYDIYGEYGLYDAVDPITGEVAYKYLALDQAMIFLAVANYLQDRRIQKIFASDPIAAKALPLIGEESFFE